MGWGLTIGNVFLSKITKAEVSDKLAEAEEDVKGVRETILMAAATDLLKGKPKGKRSKGDPDGEPGSDLERIGMLRIELGQLLDEYEEQVVKLHLLRIADECPEDAKDS